VVVGTAVTAGSRVFIDIPVETLAKSLAQYQKRFREGAAFTSPDRSSL